MMNEVEVMKHCQTRRSRSKSRSRSRSGSRESSSDSSYEGLSFGSIIEDKKQDEPERSLPETRIDVEMPKITTDLGRDIYFVKLPNFLSVETRPFDAETYEDEIDEEEMLDEEGRARLKLKVENTIRWREVLFDEEKFIKESNTRIVKWSDGSMTLHLGSEVFNIFKQSLDDDYNHLYIRQGTGLQGRAVFRSKLTFRPQSTDSFTHRKMTMSLAERSQKVTGIKVISHVGGNPDQHKQEMMKKEEEKLKMAMRAQNKKTKKSSRNRNSVRGFESHSNLVQNDNCSDDEGAISLAAIKNKYKKGVASNNEDDESDFEAPRRKKRYWRTILKDSDESESEIQGSVEEEQVQGIAESD